MSALLQVQGCDNGLYRVTRRCAVDPILRHDLRDGIPFSRESIQYERTGNSDQQVSALGYFEGAQRFVSPHGSRRELEELAQLAIVVVRWAVPYNSTRDRRILDRY